VHASHAAAYVARRQLAGFSKVRLKAGESARVTVPLDVHTFGYWDAEADRWRLDAGLYEVSMAASSRDVRLEHALIIKAGDVFDLGLGAGTLTAGEQPQIRNEEREVLAPYYGVRPGGFTEQAFMAMYNRQLPEQAPTLPITIDSPMSDMEQTGFGHNALKVVRLLEQRHMRDAGDQMQAMVESMLVDMPLRGMLMGGADYQLMDGLLDMLNGNYRSGIRKAIAGNRRMRRRKRQERRKGR
jgi:beta-glucosidase